jgi:hypothetical protein
MTQEYALPALVQMLQEYRWKCSENTGGNFPGIQVGMFQEYR